MAETPAKKSRKSVKDEEGIAEGDRDCVLMKFKQDEKLLSRLYLAVLQLDHGFSNLLATCQEIKLADAPNEKCFSRAVCFTEECSTDTPLAIGALFRTGLEVLVRFINDTGKDCLPDDESSKEALIKLLTFLSSELTEGLPEEFFCPESFTECQWTVILAQHLLSKLSLQSDYTIDDHHQKKPIRRKDGKYYCVCSKRDLMVGKFGDTSFGCPNGWHGFADILFKNNLSTTVTGKETGSGDAAEENDDVKTSLDTPSSKLVPQDVMQMISQCITFSFLQKKTDSTLKNYLIPALGISQNRLKVLFFDCDNDILLTSEDLDITNSEDKVKLPVIMLLWLTLNYKIFCTGVPDYIKKFKAKFDECVGDKLNAYKKDVHYKFSMKRTKQTETKTFEYGKNLNPVTPFPSANLQF